MPLFWKVFLSIVTVTAVAFTIGGHIMVHMLFQSSLDNAVDDVESDNKSLYTALATAVHNDPHNGDISFNALQDLSNSIEISTGDGALRFTLSDGDYNTFFSTSNPKLDKDTALALPNDSQSHLVRQIDGRYYAIVVTKTTLENQPIYIQNSSDITDIFAQKERLYFVFQQLLIGQVAVIAAIVLLLALWILRPINRLSRAARDFSGGDYSKRVEVKGKDEISTLSRDFNTMADHLEETVDELKNAVRRQEDFVGNFAHELKTPLTSIIGYADMLRSKKLEEEQQISYADYIFREGKRLEALSLKLMEIIVLEKEQLQKKPTSILFLLENVCGAVDPVLKQAKIVLTVTVQDAVIPMEADLMKTVLLNLIDNSRKAMEQGGLIQIHGERTDGGYRLTLHDNGTGIPEAELSKITEAFYMVDKSRSRKQGGAGLGLALCNQIIQLHDGTLQFESQPGNGTTVTIFLKEERP